MKNVKNRLKFVLFPVLALLLLILAVPVSAAVGLPHNFSGTVKIGGVDAPIDTVISARFQDVEYGSVTTTDVGLYSYLLVTDLTDGDVIHFYVDDVDTTQTFPFGSGYTTEDFNLTVGEVDNPPTVVISSTASDPTSTSPIPMTATFSEGVTGFELGDITVTNGTAGSFAGSGADYTFGVTATGEVAVTVNIAAGVAEDAASNPNEAATQFTINFDDVAPTATVSPEDNAFDVAVDAAVTATFAEDVLEGALGDITIITGTTEVTGVSATLNANTITIAHDAFALDTSYTVTIPAEAVEDLAGNLNAEISWSFTTVAVTFTISATAGDNGSISPSGDVVVSSGADRAFTITPDTGYEILDVLVDSTSALGDVTIVEGVGTYTFASVAAAHTISASFAATGPVTYYTLAITLDPTEGGSVTLNPSQPAGGYETGTTVELTAIANEGYVFDSWSGDLTGSANPDTITMDGNKAVTASFTEVVGNLGDELDATPPGGTVALGSGTYTGDVTIDKPITITGSEEGTTISGSITIGELTGSTVVIENLTITNYGDFGIKIVKVRDVDIFIIRNNTILGVSENVTGIQVDEVVSGGNLTIEQNAISGNGVGIKLLENVAAGDIHFNDITNNTTGLETLAVDSDADAGSNWWGDISGPEVADSNGGIGDKVVGNIFYDPWLTRDFQIVLDDNIAYFGFPMVWLNAGWNIISTPVALDPACDTWGDYVDLGDGLDVHDTNPAYSFNSQTQTWVALTSSYNLKPCNAVYVRMASADTAPILYSPDISVPSKQLYSGWNLVGLAYAPMGGGFPSMKANEALVSVEEVTGSFTGYSVVVSPPVNQNSWVYTGGAIADWDGEGESPDGWMVATYGYWVFMLNDGTLAGFTFTPMSLGV